jgi:hypothetical protein
VLWCGVIEAVEEELVGGVGGGGAGMMSAKIGGCFSRAWVWGEEKQSLIATHELNS